MCYKYIRYVLLFVLLSSGSCESDPTPKSELAKLPPATQTGENTFGCLVNGKAWVTRTSTDALAFYQSGVLQISAGIEEHNRDQGITLAAFNGIIQGQTHDLSNDSLYWAIFGGTLPPVTCTYDHDNTLNGQLTITRLDQVNYVVAGLFEFTTVASGCDTIKVTDGRFDLNYAP